MLASMALLHEDAVHGFAESTFDEAASTLRNVVLAGTESKNGYRYTEAAFRNALKLYEGRPVFLDHGAKASPFDRSIRDLAGNIASARFEGGRLRGDIRLTESEAGKTLAHLAKAQFKDVGMSHVVDGRKSRDGKLVESIEEVVSVDAVVFPATTKSFAEQRGEGRMADTENKLVEKLEEQVDTLRKSEIDLTSKLNESEKAAKVVAEKLATAETANAALVKERDELKSKVDAFETKIKLAERRDAIAKSLEKAGLDAADKTVVSESFVADLMALDDDKAREARIKDRKELVAAAAKGAVKPFSSERTDPDTKGGFDPAKHYGE